MSDECIHGLEDQLCATCFPKAVPEGARSAPQAKPRASRAREAASPTTLRTARVAPVATTASARRTASTRTARAGRGAGAASASDVGELRIYHVTHISNLPGILGADALFADANEAWNQRPTVDISSAENRAARRAIPLAGQDDRNVAGFVPFFLSPNSSVWNNIRSFEADPRLSPDAQEWTIFDFVVLVSTVGAADTATDDTSASVAVTDGDAVGPLTRFATTPEARARMLNKHRADLTAVSTLAAEFLVPEVYPFEKVSLIGVANDKVREVVRGVLATAAHRPKVSVYPPWFQPTDDGPL
ncbi:DarT ssDNA thymidine ADP-ribosyltransferase family protein [Glaciibacter superstes]|uniref:DarT ssDNA thymidine ADP-ribosyltransferase family protein n=1 Tax=Glaciibacter superstes TaxID=501023 RepID=UPI0003B44B65|nr:DarT ssDNA thymidine ADP-ribosyltransferase family protein [Glaciibacter superstes]